MREAPQSLFPASECQGARRPPFGESTVRPYPLLILHLLILFHRFSFSLSKQKSLFTRGENNSLSHPPQKTFTPVCPSPKRKKTFPIPQTLPQECRLPQCTTQDNTRERRERLLCFPESSSSGGGSNSSSSGGLHYRAATRSRPCQIRATRCQQNSQKEKESSDKTSEERRS